MSHESCERVRSQLSEYLDNACRPESLREVLRHLEGCEPCRKEFDRATAISRALRAAPRRRVPPEVALRLRVQLSQQANQNSWGRLGVRFRNFFGPLWLPASGGLITALLCLGFLMSQGVSPTSHAPDVSTDLSTPASLEQLNPVAVNVGDEPLVVLTDVDARGEATGYTILSGQRSPQITEQLDRLIYFSLFQPATMFGTPTKGKVVLMVRRITVRG